MYQDWLERTKNIATSETTNLSSCQHIPLSKPRMHKFFKPSYSMQAYSRTLITPFLADPLAPP